MGHRVRSLARIGAVLLVMLVAVVGAVQAQQVAAPQVLTLDQERLYSASLYGKALEARSQADTQNLASENRQIEADLSAEEASLTTQRPALTAADFAKLAADFDKKVEMIRAAQDAKAKQLVTDRDAGRKQFFDAAVPILAEVMRSLGAYAILNRGSVVLSFDSIDVTDRAIAALDARIGDGTKALAPKSPSSETPTPETPTPETPTSETPAPQTPAPAIPAPTAPAPATPAPAAPNP